MKAKMCPPALRLVLTACCALVCSSSLSAQKIVTVAGGYVADGGPATSAALSEPQFAAYDAQGNLYITDENNARIRKVDTLGKISTVAGNGICGFTGDGGPAAHAEICAPTGLLIDPKGNILFADSGTAHIRKIDPSGKISTIAGNGTKGYCGDGGPALNACLNFPVGIAWVGSSSGAILYVADSANHRIRQISMVTGKIRTVAGNGTSGYSGDGGPAKLAELNNPYSIAVHPSTQALWISERGNSVVREVNTGTGIITTFLGKGTCGNDLQSLCNPGGVAIDKPGNLYITDTGNGRVLKFAVANGSNTETLAAGAGSGFNGDGIPATLALLLYPASTTFDPRGNLVIVDGGNNRVRLGRGSQNISTLAGGYLGDGGPSVKADVNGSFLSSNLGIGGNGAVYVADSYDNRVRKLSGGTISTFAGTGISGHSGDGGPATAATLTFPTSVAADRNGNVYIADISTLRKVDATGMITTFNSSLIAYSLAVDGQGNVYAADFGGCVIRKFTPSGSASIVAGQEFQCGESGDGAPATLAQIFLPTGVAVDSGGNIYIAEWVGNRIRQVNSSGIISTAVGTGTCGFSGDGGPATAATICAPLSVGVDGSGNLYIADLENGRIRKVSGGIIDTIAGSGSFGYNGNNLPALETNIFPTAVTASPNGSVYLFDVSDQRVRKLQ